jgi:hypothetical protein
MQNLMQFYRHESCGQCTPCREGSAWLERVVEKILDGKASMEELDSLHDIANGIMGNTICAFGEGTAMPALAFLQKFRKEFEAYVRGERKRPTPRSRSSPGAEMIGSHRLLLRLRPAGRGGSARRRLLEEPDPRRDGAPLLILSVAGLFLALHAQFLAAIQLIVYAGAIVILFLFVIMLLGPSASTPRDHAGVVARFRRRPLRLSQASRDRGGALCRRRRGSTRTTGGPDSDFGGIDAFGDILFSDALVPFELSSALLMVAVVGAIAVARGRQGERTLSKSELEAREPRSARRPMRWLIPVSSATRETLAVASTATPTEEARRDPGGVTTSSSARSSSSSAASAFSSGATCSSRS